MCQFGAVNDEGIVKGDATSSDYNWELFLDYNHLVNLKIIIY